MDLSPFALRFVLSPLHHVKIAKKPDDSTRAGKPKCDSAMSPRLEQCHVPRQAVSSNVSAAHIFRKNIAHNCTCTHNAVRAKCCHDRQHHPLKKSNGSQLRQCHHWNQMMAHDDQVPPRRSQAWCAGILYEHGVDAHQVKHGVDAHQVLRSHSVHNNQQSCSKNIDPKVIRQS